MYNKKRINMPKVKVNGSVYDVEKLPKEVATSVMNLILNRDETKDVELDKLTNELWSKLTDLELQEAHVYTDPEGPDNLDNSNIQID